jgi:hypothetical protein
MMLRRTEELGNKEGDGFANAIAGGLHNGGGVLVLVMRGDGFVFSPFNAWYGFALVPFQAGRSILAGWWYLRRWCIATCGGHSRHT